MPTPPFFTRRSLLLGSVALGAGLSLAGCATGESAQPETSSETEYRLGSGDQLRVIVFGEADLTGQYIVSTQGTIAYPLVGSVQAAGLTIAAFTTQLQHALEAYVRAPNVSVEVANYRPFFILGEVNRPGTYPYSPHLTVQNAVATAGGFTYRANKGRVYIKHAEEPEERAYRLDNNTPVLPGDTVRIGERFF
jgi:polysaccharide export outer membrane protein